MHTWILLEKCSSNNVYDLPDFQSCYTMQIHNLRPIVNFEYNGWVEIQTDN